MKRTFLFVVALFAVCAAFAQSFPMMPKTGKTMLYAVSAKTPMGVNNMFIKQSVLVADGKTLVLAMGASLSEEGDSQNSTITYTVENGEYVISLKDAMAEALQQLQGNFEILEGAEKLKYPVELQENTTLPDASMKMKATIQGMEFELTLSVKDRTMLGKETVTVPAGTYECLKFVEKQVVTLMGQEQVTQITYWYGKDTGLVKQTSIAMGGMVSAELVLKEIK